MSRGLNFHFLLTSATNLFLATSGVITGTMIARMLGPEGRGELAAIQTAPLIIAALALLGLNEGITYFSAREPDRAGRILASGFAILAVLWIPVAGATFVLLPFLLPAQSPEVVSRARDFLWVIPLMALASLPQHTILGVGQFGLWNAVRALNSLGWVVILAVIWVAGRNTPWTIAASYLALLALLFVGLAVTIRIQFNGPFTPSRTDCGSLLRFGLPAVISNVPNLLNARLDQLIVAAFLDPAQLGLYAVALAWGGGVQPLQLALAKVVFPHIAVKPTREQQIDTFSTALKHGVILTVFLVTALSAVTPSLVPLIFGTAFASAAPVASLLVVAIGTTGFAIIIEEGLRGLGEPRRIILPELAGLVVATGGLYALLPRYGIWGAAISSQAGALVVTAGLLWQVRQLTGRPLSIVVRPTIEDVAVIGSKVLAAIRGRVNA